MCAMSPRLLRPVASGFNPKSISGLEAWYAADVASSITIATGVQQWSDLSGKGRHLTQAVTNNQPAYNSVTLNGKPTVTFDGNNDSLRAAAFTLAQPNHYFLVFRYEATISSGSRVADGRSGSGTRGGEFFDFFGPMGMFAGSLLQTSPVADATKRAFNVWDVVFNGSSSAIRLRKTASVIEGNAGSNGMIGLTLGADGNPTAASLANVSIAEFLLFSRSLPVTEADKVRQYLGNKYNLAYLS